MLLFVQSLEVKLNHFLHSQGEAINQVSKEQSHRMYLT